MYVCLLPALLHFGPACNSAGPRCGAPLALAGRLNIPCFLFSTPADVKCVGSQEVLASGSADKTTKVWRAEGGKYSCAHTFRWSADDAMGSERGWVVRS